jgi:hypothetical protein
MNFFDNVNEDLFRPLTGTNKRRYIDVLSLLWDKCRRMPMYSIEKSTVIDEVESYFIGLGEKVIFDETDKTEDEDLSNSNDYRTVATFFFRKLKNTGWLDEKDGDYEEESKVSINYKIVPILRSFEEVINPKIITYKGKLFKIYTLLINVGQQENPYETVLKEVSEDMDELNQSLRQLAASIEEHIDTLTKGKTPEEILTFFEKYEERIVVGAYHRFKTNDNLFYYRTSLYEELDYCETDLINKLIKDYKEVERVEEAEAKYSIQKLLHKIRDDVMEMEGIIRIIDDKHILYRTRAVQRAQFLLLSDGSVKSKINGLLQYYATQMRDRDEISDFDNTIPNKVFQIYGQNYYDFDSLATPSKRRKPTPIDLMGTIEGLDLELIEAEKQKLINYARSALTSENVNNFAKDLLQRQKAVSAGSVFEKDNTSIVKIIGLYTYSEANDRVFDVIQKDNYVVCAGLRFKDFTIEERKA